MDIDKSPFLVKPLCMVIYDLICSGGHRFEGWFKDAAGFERQRRAGLVQCAFCGLSGVARVPSGCHTQGIETQPVPPRHPAQESPQNKQPVPNAVAAQEPAQSTHPKTADPVLVLKTMQKYVKEKFKYVGNQFADEAIKMQEGEKPAESIYGSATKSDLNRLDEAGVSYLPLPKLPESFEN